MWRSACCLLIALILAIIGVSVDILVVEQGTTFWNSVDVTLDYGWKEMSWSIDTAYYNATRSITYDDAYSEYCVNDTGSFCDNLKSVRDAGRVYIAFNIIGIILLASALAFTILASFGKCLCNCRCRLGWIISILAMISIICFLIAFSVFLSDFSQNVNQLFEELTPYKVVNWQWYMGASIACLITAVCIGMLSLTCILWIDNPSRRDQYEHFVDPPPPGFPGFGPPPPMYPPYGQPPPYGMPPPGPPPPGYYQVQYGTNLTPV